MLITRFPAARFGGLCLAALMFVGCAAPDTKTAAPKADVTKDDLTPPPPLTTAAIDFRNDLQSIDARIPSVLAALDALVAEKGDLKLAYEKFVAERYNLRDATQGMRDRANVVRDKLAKQEEPRAGAAPTAEAKVVAVLDTLRPKWRPSMGALTAVKDSLDTELSAKTVSAIDAKKIRADVEELRRSITVAIAELSK